MSIRAGFIKQGQGLCRCHRDLGGRVQRLEIPQWMLDRPTCCRMHIDEVSVVSCEALRDLKLLLGHTLPDGSEDLLQAQHRSFCKEEDADATLT